MRRGWVGLVPVVGCASHEAAPPRRSIAAPETRCVVRISNRVTFVDGDRVTRDDAVARCKSTDGATVVLEALAPNPEWDATRAALEQEGVRIYVLDKLCNRPGRYACMPILPGHPMSDPKRRPTVQPQPQPQPKPKPKPQP